MTIIGHWDSLAEAQKLVQHELLLSGVIETIIKEGNVLPMLPIFQIDTKDILYFRELLVPDMMEYISVGEQLSWTSDQTYSEKVLLELTRAAGQRKLDKFIADTYKNPNDYRAQKMKEIAKSVTHWIERELIYGTGVGIHAQGLRKLIIDLSARAEVPTNYATTLNIDEASALSLWNLRALVDSIRPDKPDILLLNREFARRFDAHVQEAPIIPALSNGAGLTPQSVINWTKDQLGERVTYFDGVPMIRSDFITLTESATGERTGAARTSIYAIKFGQIQEGGVCAAFGGQGGELGKFFRTDYFEKLENYDAEGVRVVGYFNFAVGGVLSLGRIYNIDPAAAITA